MCRVCDFYPSWKLNTVNWIMFMKEVIFQIQKKHKKRGSLCITNSMCSGKISFILSIHLFSIFSSGLSLILVLIVHKKHRSKKQRSCIVISYYNTKEEVIKQIGKTKIEKETKITTFIYKKNMKKEIQCTLKSSIVPEWSIECTLPQNRYKHTIGLSIYSNFD